MGATYKPRLAKGISKEKNLELIGSRSGIWKPQDDHQNQFFHMILSLCLPRLWGQENIFWQWTFDDGVYGSGVHIPDPREPFSGGSEDDFYDSSLKNTYAL